MAIEMTKPWRPLTAGEVAKLSGQLGVFELADTTGSVTYIGFAGGKSLYGLRSELEKHLGKAAQFRVEVNMQYTTRHRELLMAYRARTGRLPAMNEGNAPPLGRLSPG
jgi:hypothetical protein